MTVTQAQRASMYATLVDAMGQDDAETLMDHLPTVDWDQIATKDDLKAAELRILADLVQSKQALADSNQALADAKVRFSESIARGEQALADAKVSFGESIARGEQALADAKVRCSESVARGDQALADAKVSFNEALGKTNAEVVALRGEVQLGFARLERRLAWYLVAVTALLVGFGIAVWIPLVDALAENASAVPPAVAAIGLPSDG